MAVKEIRPEELFKAKPVVTSASIVFFQDGKQRIIAERPGQFCLLTNADGEVPILKTGDE
jgi:hypothetical protein